MDDNNAKTIEGKTENTAKRILSITISDDCMKAYARVSYIKDMKTDEYPPKFNVDEIMKNAPRIGDAAQKLASLDVLLKETKNGIEDIKSERSGIGKTEQRLMALNTEIDNKLNALKAVSDAQNKKSPTQEENFNTPQVREQVHVLKRQSWTNKQIANALKIPEYAVELILETSAY